MPLDPWQQWQALAALFNPTASASKSARGRTGAPPFAPFVAVAERFGVAARTYFEGVNALAAAPGEPARIFSASLRELFADVQPWNSGIGAAAGLGSVPPAITPNAPAVGATREHQLRWQRVADAWRRLEVAQRRLQRMGSDALREAAATFAARLGTSHPPTASTASTAALQQLYDSWIDCAEDAYARAAHSESFCDTLAECVNASSEWRRELQAGIEHSAKLLDLPTRSEINTLTLRVKSLEENLRALRQVRTPKPAASTTRPTRRNSKP